MLTGSMFVVLVILMYLAVLRQFCRSLNTVVRGIHIKTSQFQFIDTFNEHSTTLYLKIQVNNTNARVSSESISSWSEKSLEEKLEPLQRYLRSK